MITEGGMLKTMMSQTEHLLPFSSGQPHISTYPAGTGGILQPKPSPTSEADKNTGSQWHDLPKGWTADSRDHYADSMAHPGDVSKKENQEGPVSTCMDKIGSHVSDPGAFCASLHDRVTGTTDWRGKNKEALSMLGGILSPKSPREADGGSSFPQALRSQKNEKKI